MGAADLPGARRPLSDAADAAAPGAPGDARPIRDTPPDGARSPRELLDNLCERLSRLPANHPSSVHEHAHGPYRPRGDWVEAGEPVEAREPSADSAGALAAAELTAAAPGAAGRESAADQVDADDLEAEQGDTELTPRDSDAAWRAARGNGLWSAPLDLGPAGSGEPFQPWFMSGELGDPWFTEPPPG